MSVAWAAGGRERARVASAAGGCDAGEVGGAALGGPAPLDEAAGPVRVLLGLQRRGGEDVRGQAAQLVGPAHVSLVIQLRTDQSEERGGGVSEQEGSRGGFRR